MVIKGEDYIACETAENEVLATEGENLQNKGGRPLQDYKISANLATKLAMISNSPKGEEARDYFIGCETGLVLTIKRAEQTVAKLRTELTEKINALEAFILEQNKKTDARLGIIESGTVLWQPSPWVDDMLERLEFIRHFYRDRNGNFTLKKIIGYFIQEAHLDLEPVRKVMMRETRLDREPRALEIIDYDENLQWRFTCKVQKAYEEFGQPYYKDDMSFLDAIEVIRM